MPTIGFSIGQLHSSLLLLTIFMLSNTMLAMQGSYADVVTKQFTSLNPRSGSRFLAGKGTHCNSGNVMECTAPNGSTDQLSCCSTMCTDVLSDSKNCGSCGKQCPFGQLCCMGTCTTVAYDEENCGSCGVVCQNGSMCTYGFCGYAT
ncbi:Stigma-specific STIG1-like protein 2 [Carex littledalei]|uniref:Stigma-specific STIG1-like protein 2 n=1 Tax=Carex littledalei TaxID=544730 RepID=A0A833REF4_9POAL|nr:Stigma-specific STIG1-like protein 2 [Carex littledalei]